MGCHTNDFYHPCVFAVEEPKKNFLLPGALWNNVILWLHELLQLLATYTQEKNKQAEGGGGKSRKTKEKGGLGGSVS